MLSHSVTQFLLWLSPALAIVALLVAYWMLRRKNMYRRELPRVFELHDLVMPSSSPDSYFRNFEQSLSEIRQKLRQFRDIEADLQGLDAEAWAFLKSEVAPLLKVRHLTRGWQFLFDKLNQAKAYNYLKSAGYPNVRFIPPSAVSDWIRRKIMPGPIPGTHTWDRKAIDAALDRLPGLQTTIAPASAFDQWKASQDAS